METKTKIEGGAVTVRNTLPKVATDKNRWHLTFNTKRKMPIPPSQTDSFRSKCSLDLPWMLNWSLDRNITNMCSDAMQKYQILKLHLPSPYLTTSKRSKIKMYTKQEANGSSVKEITCTAAVAWGPGQPFSIQQIRVQPPQKLEVRIKILFASICHTDLSAWRGENESQQVYPRIFGHRGLRAAALLFCDKILR
ncbi:hypothetical protein QVD17_39825 [Tagetes erecta]|uniref:Alcohol dehydrogenase n=1 Tax=Tagetes erecta TaxID=13708 RepID=A0AAD8JV51_TARER|nr:hypothetical protein QVD17_39825 [Tagetes erecta]